MRQATNYNTGPRAVGRKYTLRDHGEQLDARFRERSKIPRGTLRAFD